MKRDLPPQTQAIRVRHSCVRCGVSLPSAEDLDEHENNGCDPEDLWENAARNADDQIGVYG